MSLQVGIVGLPNVGKSTLFNALTSAKAEAANYPFCTIDPNVGVVTVPDPRLEAIASIYKPEKILPTAMEFVDIAGLVAGASKGEGLGNQFLANIRQTDAICHVVRCFVDPNITHVSGSIDPLRDIDTINTELMLADLETVEKRKVKVEKAAQTTQDKKLKLEYSALKKVFDALQAGRPARSAALEEPEEPIVKELHLLSSKPVLYVCNVSENASLSEKFVTEVAARAKSENNQCVTICSAIEAEIALLDEADKKEFLTSIGAEEPGLHRLIRASYELLTLITYFTAGPKEVRAWTITRETKAPQAAGKIHSDFERGFIRAEVFHFEDLMKHKSEAAVKEAGRYRSEGKDYVVKDGDLMLFRFNV